MKRTLLAVGAFVAVAAGFAAVFYLIPTVQEERREFLDTYAFLKGYMQPEWLGKGWRRPNPTSFGAPSKGKTGELKIPVESQRDADIELVFDFSPGPKFEKRKILVQVNGEDLGGWPIIRRDPRQEHRIRVPKEVWRNGGPLEVKLAGTELGDRQDAPEGRPRKDLGIILHTVSVYEVWQPQAVSR